MPRFLKLETIEQLNKVPYRINLVWIKIPPLNGNDRELLLTDHFHDIKVVLEGEERIFKATTGLMSVGTMTDNLEAKDAPLTISLDGVLKSFTSVVLQNKVKGSAVLLYRAFYNQETGGLFGEPQQRWGGRVDAANIQDTTDINTDEQGTMTVVVDCRSIISLLKTLKSGIRTNESDWKRHYPNDTSMHNIAGLANTEFNFGKD